MRPPLGPLPKRGVAAIALAVAVAAVAYLTTPWVYRLAVTPFVEGVRDALVRIDDTLVDRDPGTDLRRDVHVLFVTHSIPTTTAVSSVTSATSPIPLTCTSRPRSVSTAIPRCSASW